MEREGTEERVIGKLVKILNFLFIVFLVLDESCSTSKLPKGVISTLI